MIFIKGLKAAAIF